MVQYVRSLRKIIVVQSTSFFFCTSPSNNPWLLHIVHVLIPSFLVVLSSQARKTTNMMKKTTSTRNILIISQRLEETDWKYLRISVWAMSTFSWVSSTLESILQNDKKNIHKQHSTWISSFTSLNAKYSLSLPEDYISAFIPSHTVCSWNYINR